MNRFLIAASCLALVAPSLAMAQMSPDHAGKPAAGQQGRPSKGGGGQYRPAPGNPGSPVAGRPGGMPGVTRPSPQPGATRPSPGWPGGGRPGRPSSPGYSGGRGQAWSNGHFGWNGRRFRAGAFSYPQGYGYQRWGVGQSLPLVFLSAAYFFADYAALGFEAPPWGYQWVRYGPDLLLVNINTGQIMDVEYNVFY